MKLGLKTGDEFVIEYIFALNELADLFRHLTKVEDRFFEQDFMYDHEVELNEENEWTLRVYVSKKDG